MVDMTKPRYWKIRGSFPVTRQYNNGKDYTYSPEVVEGVVARTASEAIATFMAAHPDGVVWAVNHTGEIHATASSVAARGGDQ